MADDRDMFGNGGEESEPIEPKPKEGLPEKGAEYPHTEEQKEPQVMFNQVDVTPPIPPGDKLTIVESIYHQPFGEQPTQVENRFEQILSSSEQPYQRKLKATEEWQQLDFGWLESVGMILIVNTEGKFLQLQPTEEEKEETAKKVLELCYRISVCPFGWSILPGASFRGQPNDPTTLHIRSQSGVTRFMLYAWPK